MKKRTELIELIDDIDGTPNARTATFAVEGVKYEIELTEKNLKGLHRALKPYTEKGRKVSGNSAKHRTVTKAKKKKRGPSTKEIREWAKGQNLEVGDTGMIPQEIIKKYNARKG